MTDNSERPPEDLAARIEATARAARKATREAVLRHAKLGQPVATTRDGKVVWLQPEEVLALLAEEPDNCPPTNDAAN